MSTVFEAFKTRAEAVSAEVHRFPSRDEALAFIQAFLREEGVAEAPQCGAVWAPGSFLEGVGGESLVREVPGLSFAVTREASAEARVGISQMDWGISATGTLVQDATGVEQRLVSTLPPIHLAVIGTERILEDLGAVLKRLPPERIDYIAFITGPSRTADIERVLTIGVHGPGQVEDVALYLGGVGGAEDLGAPLLGVALELAGQLLEAGGRAALDLGDTVPHGVEVDAFVGLGPAHPVGLGEAAQGAGEVPVVEGGLDGVLELGRHAGTLPNSSTATITSRPGPWTPMVSTRSMSAVRLGPVMKAM